MADVRVIAPDGTTGSVPEEDLSTALGEGFSLAEQAPSGVQAQYGDQEGRALLEGVARGGTAGLSDVVQAEGAGIGTGLGNYFADLAGLGPEARATAQGLDAGVEQIDRSGEADAAVKQAKADLLGRKEANATAATLGEITGAVGLGLATGGLGTAGLAARGATTLGRAGSVALAGAIEGAAYGAAQAADRDFLEDREITASRILMGAGEGALLGGALGGGASLFGSGVKAVAGKAAEKLSGTSVGGYLDKLAGDSAYKAVVGRTSKRAMKEAERQGGAEAVGETLLREGIDLTGNAEQKLAAVAAKADEVGAKLGAVAKEADALGQGGPSRIGLRDAIREKVLKPLREGTFSEGTADTVEARLGKMLDKLSKAESPVLVRGPTGTRQLTRDTLSFEELRNMRRELDDELANWNVLTADKGPLKAYRDTRRIMEDYWLESAEEAAQKVGRAGFADEVRALKKTYAHLALARDQAQEAVQTQLANRATSPSDYLAGIGTAGSIGGLGGLVTGAVTSQVHGLVRERGRGVLATAIYRARQAAARGEQQIDDSAKGLIASVVSGAGAKADRVVGTVPIAGVVLNASNTASYEKTVQKLVAMQDPTSDERQKLRDRYAELADESPEHAAALEQQIQRSADYLLTKAGPTGVDISRPFSQLRPPKLDKAKAESLARAARAVQNPAAAFKRVSDGTHTREDVEVLQNLHPALWKRFTENVMSQLADLKEPPSYAARLRLSKLLGKPMTAFEEPRFQQAIAASQGTTEAAEKRGEAKVAQLARGTANVDIGSDRAIARGQ